MSNGNWNVRIAVIGSLAALVLVAFGSGLYFDKLTEISQVRHTAQSAATVAREYPKPSAEISGVASSPASNLSTRPRDQAYYDREDLNAQRSMAKWTERMGQAAVAGIFLSLIGMYLIFNTFRETRKAADAAILAQRPWLDLDVSLQGISPGYRREGYYLNIALKLINLGNTPANAVRHEVVFSFYSGIDFGSDLVNMKPRDDMLQHSSSVALAAVRLAPKEGPTVFPRSEYTLYISPMAPWDFDKGKASDFGWLTVGIRYSFPGGEGETVKVFCVRSLGFPSDSGFDYIGDGGLGYSDLNPVIRPWDTDGIAT